MISSRRQSRSSEEHIVVRINYKDNSKVELNERIVTFRK